ncbi:hypothetical protein C772_02792 [Bhargavaea cecembensis DSE10]|uniref:Uncharacterized protein n=1 Tax=Bhargavaea cecembensis DSE10 TaxID=1235279 RepID=M7NDG6_9BACL|nr:hypothetical protein [Bhargavaea cecembensis]EMR05216.1 hypothetical protein C772_02792 [Bhargavaea cecembensis DSE10]
MAERDGGPLLFVNAPPAYFVTEPVYSREAVEGEVQEAADGDEESTSVYELPKRPEETARLLTQLRFLSRPFQREVYRPIQFRLKNGTEVTGEIEQLEDGRLFIREQIEDEQHRELSVDELEAIWWKGKPFPYES